MLAALMIGSLRNARRAGVELGEQARLANLGLADNARDSGFVTGQVARIDLPTGTARIVNAGHPLPPRLSDGRVERIALQVDPPFGTVREHRYQVQPLPLRPGDRLMFFTDGLVERNTTTVDIESKVAGLVRSRRVRRVVLRLAP